MRSLRTMPTRVLVALGALSGVIATAPSTAALGAASSAHAALHCAPSGTAGIAGAGGSHVDILDSLAQILPTQPQQGGSRAYLCQARNAFESFQIEVSADKHTLKGVRMTASALRGPGHTTIPASDVQLSREAYVRLRKASDGDLSGVVHRDPNGNCTGDCRFPDPLIPDVDSVFHEKRKAFPFAVPKGENRAVWVDVEVPKGQQAGTYVGSIKVRRGAGKLATVPIELAVLHTTLPSTSSIGGAFFITLGGGRVPASQWSSGYREYAELGLDNGITITPNNDIPEQKFDATFKALLTGTSTHVLLPGARLTAFPMPTGNIDYCVGNDPGGDPGTSPCLQGDTCIGGTLPNCHIDPQYGWGTQAVTRYYADLTRLGLRDKAFLYCDEYTPTDCANSYAATADGNTAPPLVAIDDPGVRHWPEPSREHPSRVIPSPVHDVATVKALIVEPGYMQSETADRLPGLRAWQQAGTHRELWAYTTCDSAGCTGYTAKKYGMVSYGIDQVASEQRAMGWQLFTHRLHDELYYSVDRQLNIDADPMEDGVNGDGTLFYGYTKQRVGGTHPVPLESIRLKRIRDGRQDYELLTRAAGRSTSDAQKVRQIASNLFPAFDQSAVSPEKFDAARTRVVALLR